MGRLLSQLFERLDYTRENGLYLIDSDKELILKNFPYRISRILADVIKPYAIFNIDNSAVIEEHISPINNPIILFYDNPSESEFSIIAKHSFNLSRAPIVIISNHKKNSIDIFHGFDFSKSSGPPEVANRLIGRLIFIRYLIDRNVSFSDYSPLAINEESFDEIKEEKERRRSVLNSILLDHEEAYKLFDYISRKFKGDLFPLITKEGNTKIFEKNIVSSENLNVIYHLLIVLTFLLETKSEVIQFNHHYLISMILRLFLLN